MNPIVISSFDELKQLEGKEIGVSDYLQITQPQINIFADATLDHQWIHCDEEKAKAGPYQSTIAHGYLIVSILPHLWDQVVEIRNSKMTVNYGIEKLRFMNPVLVNSRVRVRVKLQSAVNLRGTTKTELAIVMEIEGVKKPAFEGNIIFLYSFV
ncbi:MAG: MaoC family dehydratase [Paludibacter sp.]|nr:MaoC family dehydratase [Paludibacter sp.]